MTDPIVPADKAGEENDIEKLKIQVENLNKGIATYRDAASEATRIAKESQKALEEFAKKNPPEKKDEPKLNPEDEARFEAYAKKNGFVTVKELEAERIKFVNDNAKNFEQQAVAEFLEKHPDYDDDEEWKKVTKEFELYKAPTSLTGYRQLLERVYKNLNPGKSQKDAKAEVKAELINRSRLGLGGRNSGGGASEDDKSIEAMQAKYPSLSREQIETRLAQIKALYPKKETK